jgi:tRNA (Thr-GGU) A37 N-methylase
MEEHRLRPIGTIHTGFTQAEHTPIQSARSEAPGTVEVFPDYTEGLAGVEGFSHLYLLYLVHRADPSIRLTVKM